MSNSITNLLGDSYSSLVNDVINATNNTSLSSAQTALNTSQAVSGGYNQLLTDLYKQYGPQLAAAGLDIGKSLQQGQVDANASVANSAGGQAALQAAITADKTANPQFYATRELESSRLSDLMKSIDLSGKLSGSEERAIGQSLARQNDQTGTVNIPSAAQTVSNAMTYGDKTYQRQEQAKSDLSSAIGQATQFMPASKSGVNSWEVSTGGSDTASKTGQSSLGLFGGTASGTNSNASTIGNLMSNVISAYTGISNTNANNSTSSENNTVSSGTGIVRL